MLVHMGANPACMALAMEGALVGVGASCSWRVGRPGLDPRAGLTQCRGESLVLVTTKEARVLLAFFDVCMGLGWKPGSGVCWVSALPLSHTPNLAVLLSWGLTILSSLVHIYTNETFFYPQR
jgi:hypothetical protein